MSLNLNSSFVCIMCIFLIYVSGTPLTDTFIQAQSIKAADLPLTNQISENLYEEMALDDFSRPEEKNEEESLCKSILTTLTLSQLLDTFKLSMVKIENLIGNHNPDTRQIIISNILTILHSCLEKKIAENDFNSVQKKLRDVIFENNAVFPTESKIIWKLPDVSMNFNDNVSADVHPEDKSEESRFGSGHEFDSRDLDEHVKIPMTDSELGISSEKKKKNVGMEDEAYFFSNNGGLINSEKQTSVPVKGFFLFQDAAQKPAIDRDLSRKIFLFGKSEGMDPTKSNGDTRNNGNKTHFLFDDMAKLSLNDRLGNKAPSFDYE